MHKRLPVLGVLAVLAFIVLGYVYLSSPPAPVAQLIIDSGQAELMRQGAWEGSESGTELLQGDSVRTLEGSEARIIFFESTVMRLAPETEVEIQALSPDPDDSYVYIRQESGRTWNKILKLSGISSYEVETPTTVVSVRGTAFSLKVEAGLTDLQLAEGEVNASTYEVREGVKERLRTIRLSAGKALKVRADAIREELKPADMAEDEFIRRQLQRDKEFLEAVKARLVKRLKPYVPVIKERYGITDEQVRSMVDEFISGESMPQQMSDMMKRIMRERLEIRPQSIAEPVPLPLEQVRKTTEKNIVLTEEERKRLLSASGGTAAEAQDESRLLTEVVEPEPLDAAGISVPEQEDDASVNETDSAVGGLVEDIGSIQTPVTGVQSPDADEAPLLSGI